MRPSSLFAVLLLIVSIGGAEAGPPPDTGNPLVGKAFGATDALRWMTKNGKPFRFEDHAYTLLRWWTNRCSHCSASLPALARLERKHAVNGLRMVAVYHPKGRALRTERTIRAYLGKLGFAGDVAVDRRWVKLKNLMARGKLTQATSVSFLVDSSGVVRWVHPGPRLYTTRDADWVHADRSYRELDALLTRLLDPARRRILCQRHARTWRCSPDGSGAGPFELGRKADATPDGKYLVVAYPSPVPRSAGSMFLWDLALFTRDGAAARHWRGDGIIHGAVWSPDGAQLAFVRGGRLLRVDAAGGKPTVLTDGVGYGGVSWR